VSSAQYGQIYWTRTRGSRSRFKMATAKVVKMMYPGYGKNTDNFLQISPQFWHFQNFLKFWHFQIFKNFDIQQFTNLCYTSCVQCPPFLQLSSQRFWRLRCQCYKIVEHRIYETLLIFTILLSSIALVFEDINLNSQKRSSLKIVLYWADVFFCLFFSIEMIMKVRG